MAVDFHIQAYDYDANQFRNVAIDPVSKAILVKDITEGVTDHGELIGLADDDHSQYYNAARHTKTVHDALAIDHGSLFGRGDDDHALYLTVGRHDLTARHGSAVVDHGSIGGLTHDDHSQYLNTTRHDTTTRHPVSVIKTATGSTTGSLGGGVEINIGMNRKSFAPQITTGNNDAIATGTYGTASDPNDYVGRFQIWNDSGVTIPYWIRWDYLSSSGPPQIWVITDDKGKIIHCWEAEDVPDPDNPDLAPIEHKEEDGSGMPADWHSLKIDIPSDYGEIKKKAKERKKTLSKHIFDDYEVDIKNKKLKKRGK